MDDSAVRSARILVVDDEVSNIRLLEALLEVSGFTEVTGTGDSSAVVGLCVEHEPDLIVLDLNMPPPDGFELLGMLSPWIRGPARLPILVATADATPETKRRVLAAGARDFLTKPLDPSEVVTRIENLLEVRLLQAELRLQNDELERRVAERTSELEQANSELLEPLAFAAEYRDEDPHEHTLRVGRTSALLAGGLGLAESVVAVMDRAARLHDVGKLGLSDSVLLNTGRYTAEDFELMKTHVLIGAEILSRGRSTLLRTATDIARTHHERWNGSGYIEGLRGEEIPMVGRIVAVADTFDALTRRRPYREAMPTAKAVAEIRGLAARDFDPRVVAAFESLDHASLVGPLAVGEPAE